MLISVVGFVPFCFVSIKIIYNKFQYNICYVLLSNKLRPNINDKAATTGITINNKIIK